MTYKDFVEATICDLSQPLFEELKQWLLDFDVCILDLEWWHGGIRQ